MASATALLLLGFAGALRRSELVGLTLGDIAVVPNRGLRLLIRRSKTDQRGAGQQIAIWANPKEPGLCPAQALQDWLGFCQAGGDRTGVSDKAVWRLVKQAARDAGLANPEGYSGHSLRAASPPVALFYSALDTAALCCRFRGRLSPPRTDMAASPMRRRGMPVAIVRPSP